MFLRRPKARFCREAYMEPRDREMFRRARKREDLTQMDLAVLCRCTQATISGLETGNLKACSEDLAKEIARRLKLDVEDLFIRKESSRVQRVTNAASSTSQGHQAETRTAKPGKLRPMSGAGKLSAA